MSIAEPSRAEEVAASPAAEAAPSAPRPSASRRPAGRVILHWVRRAHLYLGLFLFPWAVLYGVTAFLFTHPTVLSDQPPSTRFGKDELKGTPMESPPAPDVVAAEVVEALNKRAKKPPGTTTYVLGEPPDAKYVRDSAFATVRTAQGEQISLLFDVSGNGGSVRAQPRSPDAKPAEPAPFAVGRAPRGQTGKGRPPRGGPSLRPSGGEDRLALTEQPLHERIVSAAGVVLERSGFDGGEVTVTSVPDLTFEMEEADGTRWTVTYNALTGTVSGQKSAEVTKPGVSQAIRKEIG